MPHFSEYHYHPQRVGLDPGLYQLVRALEHAERWNVGGWADIGRQQGRPGRRT